MNLARTLYHKARFKAFQIAPEFVLKRQFKLRTGYDLDLKNPKTYNEKLQWLKLFWHDERATKLADKYLVRDYVKSKGLGFLLNEIYGVYEHPDKINLGKLPNEFVIKPTHGSGKVIFCENKNYHDWRNSRGLLMRWLKKNHYISSFEWVYDEIVPRIIIEKKIKTPDNKPPRDYKFFCFSGEPKCLFVATDRGAHTTKFDFFDLQWNRLPVRNHYPNFEGNIPRPEKLADMIRYAKLLCGDFPHVRIDFYYEEEKIIFGECTFFHFSGQEAFVPNTFDYELGSYLELPSRC